jgi:hypothetical protein
MMRYVVLVLCAAALAACAHDPLNTGDADMDNLHAQSWQAAQTRRGKDYVFERPTKVCRDKDEAVLGPHLSFPGLPRDRSCPTVAGRFRVVDALLMQNGSTLLQVSGEGIAGYMPYEIFLPAPYKPVSEYFPTGK